MSKPKEIDLGSQILEKYLWELTIKKEKMLLEELTCNLDIAYLEKLGTDDWNLTPRMLVESFDIETDHAKKVEDADLSFPIEIYNFRGQWIILDGVHRYTKAVMSNYEYIDVRKVSEKAMEQLRKKI